MKSFFSKYKIFFILMNILLIFLYLYPGSFLGCLFYNDCGLQPQITKDFLVSTNHLYAFFILSIIGLFTYSKKKEIKILILYLFLISIFLEISHNFIPNRNFEWTDVFGNIFGVLLSIIIFKLLKKNKTFKK